MDKKKMETERISLRPWQDSDAETLFKYASDPDVGPRAGWPPHKSVEESLEVIRNVFNKDTTTWAIVLRETGEVIGAMGYGAIVSYLPVRASPSLAIGWQSLIGIREFVQRLCNSCLTISELQRTSNHCSVVILSITQHLAV